MAAGRASSNQVGKSKQMNSLDGKQSRGRKVGSSVETVAKEAYKKLKEESKELMEKASDKSNIADRAENKKNQYVIRECLDFLDNVYEKDQKGRPLGYYFYRLSMDCKQKSESLARSGLQEEKDLFIKALPEALRESVTRYEFYLQLEDLKREELSPDHREVYQPLDYPKYAALDQSVNFLAIFNRSGGIPKGHSETERLLLGSFIEQYKKCIKLLEKNGLIKAKDIFLKALPDDFLKVATHALETTRWKK